MKMCGFVLSKCGFVLSKCGFVPSKTVIFIWGLILSHAFVKNAVVYVLMDFLSDVREKYSLREGAMVVNLLDGLSAILVIVVMHVSQAYTGRFAVIIFCTGVYVMGLMLSWVYTLSKYLPPEGQLLSLISGPSISISPLSTFIIAQVLIALGRAGGGPILRGFLDHQLREKGGSNENHTGATNLWPTTATLTGAERGRSNENRTGATNLWPTTATFTGAAIAVFCFGNDSWRTRFQISSLVMGAMYILFFFGIFCYYPEEREPTGSPLTTIYRVFKAAIKKRSLPYPCSEEDYYANNNNQGPTDSENCFDGRQNAEAHLSPRHPSFLLFLDKAAIIRNNSNVERELRNGELCPAEQVRAVKSLYPIVILGFTFFAYSLVLASANTYFVEQTSNLDYRVGTLNAPIMVFFALDSLVAFMVKTIQSKILVKPHFSIALGLFCSILCNVAAWRVEHHRLFLIRKYPDKAVIPLSIMVLTPQYFLLGLMEGFAEDGLETFVCGQMTQSMGKDVIPYIEMMVVIIGKFSSIFCALISRSWFKESINTSHMDRYFLFLVLLNFVFLVISVSCAKLLAQSAEERNIEMSPTSRPREETVLSRILSVVLCRRDRGAE